MFFTVGKIQKQLKEIQASIRPSIPSSTTSLLPCAHRMASTLLRLSAALESPVSFKSISRWSAFAT